MSSPTWPKLEAIACALAASLTGVALAVAGPTGPASLAGDPRILAGLAWVAWLPLLASLAAARWSGPRALVLGAGSGAVCAGLSGLAWAAPTSQGAWVAIVQAAAVAGGLALARRARLPLALALPTLLAVTEHLAPAGWGLALAASQARLPSWRAGLELWGAVGLAAALGAANAALWCCLEALMALRRQSSAAVAPLHTTPARAPTQAGPSAGQPITISAMHISGRQPRAPFWLHLLPLALVAVAYLTPVLIPSPPAAALRPPLSMGLVQSLPGADASRARRVQARELWRQGAQAVVWPAAAALAANPEAPPRPRAAASGQADRTPPLPPDLVRAAGHIWGVLPATSLASAATGRQRLQEGAEGLVVVDGPATCGQAGHITMAARRLISATQLRAAELARPILVGGDLGMALAVEATGQFTSASAPCRRTNLLLGVAPGTRLTPYAQWGNLPLLFAASLGWGLAVWARQRRQPSIHR